MKEELQAALIATQRARAGLQGCSCSSLQLRKEIAGLGNKVAEKELNVTANLKTRGLETATIL